MAMLPAAAAIYRWYSLVASSQLGDCTRSVDFRLLSSHTHVPCLSYILFRLQSSRIKLNGQSRSNSTLGRKKDEKGKNKQKTTTINHLWMVQLCTRTKMHDYYYTYCWYFFLGLLRIICTLDYTSSVVITVHSGWQWGRKTDWNQRRNCKTYQAR